MSMGLYQNILPLKFRNWLRPIKTPIDSIIKFYLRIISRDQIISGPFKGMQFRYPNIEYAMLLGTWELELKHIWEEVFSGEFSLMIDVGAAEGYYAVGMAKRNPSAKVIAFEMDDRVRKNLNILNEINSACVEIREKCDVEDLFSFGQSLEDAFILMDVEGYESVLLDPQKVPALKKSTMLIEIHEMYVNGVSELLEERFNKTHKILQIHGVSRSVDHFPSKAGIAKKLFSPKRLIQFMDEGRPHEMSWYYMKPIKPF